MHFQLAWRNIWRNPRRTMIIMTAIVIGVWSMVFLGALMRGMAVNVFENGISDLTGGIQIRHEGYRNDPSIENRISDPEQVEKALQKTLPDGAQWTKRVRVGAIASNARHSAGITLVGVDPFREQDMSFIGQGRIEGRFLESNDMRGIVVGKALLDKFETKVGHKLVLMSQGTDGEIASKAFRIIGVFRTEITATEKAYVFVNLPAAQKMLKMENHISEVSIILPEHKGYQSTADALKEGLPNNYEVYTWRDLLPMVRVWIDMLDGFSFVWYLVTFIAMGFGIVNTLLMAVFERMREFGLLKALGMKPWWVIKGVLLESFFILIIGTVAGNILALIFIYIMSGTGLNLSAFAAGAGEMGMSRVIYPVIHLQDIGLANVIVLFLGLLISLYPASKAAKFTPAAAMAKY